MSSSTDEDLFRVVLGSDTDLWVYTTGDLDTEGVLLSPGGSALNENEDGRLLDSPWNFLMRHEASAGTYYVRVTSAGQAGEYTLHVRTVTDPGNSVATATTVTPGAPVAGRISPTGGVGGDKDVYKLVVASTSTILVASVGVPNTFGELLDSGETVLESNDNARLVGNSFGFMLLRTLEAGTYYIKVRGKNRYDIGSYTLQVRTVVEPGNSTTTAAPVSLSRAAPGRITSASDQDYFRITLEEEAFILAYGLTLGDALPLTATVVDDEGASVDVHIVTQETWAATHVPWRSFRLFGRLPAGASYIRVTATGTATGSYVLQPLPSPVDNSVHDTCTALATPRSDPLYGCQWYLNNTGQFGNSGLGDINVEPVWTGGNKGEGINVAIVDDGLDAGHEDLADNVILARNHDTYRKGGVFDPQLHHGTSVAGIVAARDNGIGLRGVAPRASIYGYNLTWRQPTFDQRAAAMVRDLAVTAISNNSWGPSTKIVGGITPPRIWELAVERGVQQGFGGKGIFYVWSGGNGRLARNDANLDGYANFYAVTATCAVNHADVQASYSEAGANIWVCAPSGDSGMPGVATTTGGSRYVTDFGGTSAAAPIVSGVAALVRAANTALTWRDVKLILAASARRNDTGSHSWGEGALRYGSTSQHYWFSRWYGFGVVDAAAAVTLANSWTNLPAMRVVEATSGSLDLQIADTDQTGVRGPLINSDLTVDSNYVKFVEFVSVEVTMDHASLRDLRIRLRSPTVTRSELVEPVSEVGAWPLRGIHRFGSAQFLGEDASGEWRLQLGDYVQTRSGSLKSWKITVYGHGYTPGYPDAGPITPATDALTVAWLAPSDIGGSAITSYDLRYIRSDATDKAAANWTEVTGLAAAAPLSHEVTGLDSPVAYDVQVRAVNDAGPGPWYRRSSGTTEGTATAHAAGGANEPPQFPATETGARSVAENTGAGENIGPPVAATDAENDSLIYTLGRTDAAAFAIDASSGQLRTSAALDYEGKGFYTVTVFVSDAKDADGNADTATDATMTVAITVTNVDEAGALTISPQALRIGSVIGARLSDPDGDVDPVAVSWTWSTSSDKAMWSAVSTSSSNYAPVDADLGRYLQVTARYTDGHGSGKQVQIASEGVVGTRDVTPNLTVRTLVSGLDIPWDIAFTPDGTMLFTERGGVLSSRLSDGTVQTVTADFSDLFVLDTAGLMAITVDPNFSANRRFYTCLTHTGPEVQVIAWTIDDAYTTATRVADPLVGGIPASAALGWNSGCRLRFGPEGYLWIATGDAHSGTVPQNLNSLGGKILRVIASTGAAAPGNPFGSRLYTYGHRNPQGLARRPGTTEMWTVEHGPDFDDEINVLTPGGNYGWDPVPGYNEAVPMTDLEKFPGAIEAKWSSGVPPVAPSGGVFIEGARWQNWAGAFAVAALKAESLRIFHFTDDGTFASQVIVAALDGTYGRLRTPLQGPDGALYITTSNGGSKDRILQVIPNKAPLFTERASAQEVAEDADTSTIAATPSASDPDGDALTYTLSGRGAGTFEIADPSVGGIRPRVALDHETTSFFDVLLTATDPYGASDTVVVLIVVTNVDEAPKIEGPASVAVGEGASSRVVATYSARDPEGRATTWSLSGTDSEDFEISAGGVLSFVHAPDADTPADDNGDNVYMVTVEASDRVKVGKLDVTVTVTDVNSAPAFTSSSTTRSVAENAAAGQDIGAPVATTDDDGDSLTYTLGGADASSFEIVADSGQLQTRSALDFETRSSYAVTVSVSDGKDAGGNTDATVDDTISVTISVTDVNEPPAFPANIANRSVDENTAAGQDIGAAAEAADADGDSLAYTLGGTGAASFDISASSGQLQTRNALDFETRPWYTVTVSVSDGKNAAGNSDATTDDTITVTISVRDLEEDGAITVPTDQPQAGAALAATLSDPDGGVTAVTWQWQVSDDQSAWSGITTAASASYTPVAGDENRYLRVTASYSDRRGSGKRAERSLRNRVRPAPVINSPPEFLAASTTRSVDENTSSGRPIGAPVEAVDSDALTYALGGADAASFSIDRNTGQLRSDATLDYESRSSYSLTVAATDPSATSDSIAVTINVTDRNEPPAFPTSPRAPLSIDENTDPGLNIGSPLTAIDEDDGDSLTYSLDRASDAVFGIDPDKGLLRTEASLNHETTDSYRVVVQVSDGDDDDGKPDPAIDDTITLTIEVNDRNEAPAVTGETSISYAEDRSDALASYAHNDPDERATITWSLSGTDRDDFAIDDSGVLSFTDRPDHDDPRDSNGDNEYHVTVVASDGVFSDSLGVRITVTGVNEGPDVSGPWYPSYAEHGTQPVATYADNDPEDDDIEWSLSGDDAGDFEISMDGVLDFREAPDHEHPRDANEDNEYHVNVTAFDGALDDSLAVTITVTDVNEPPTLTGRSIIPVDEHGDGFVTSYQADDPDLDAALGWTLSGSDADHFAIDADGHLNFRYEADYEDPRDADSNNVYHLTVHVFDGANTPSLDVTVAVENVDEAGALSLSSIQPQVAAPLTATLTDPDGSITNQSWQWQSSSDRSAWSDIVSTTTRAYTPKATDEGRFLRVIASYSDGHGPRKSAATILDAVRADPTSNTPPTFPTSETGQRSVRENTPAGEPIGDPIAADDAGDPLTYSLDSAGDSVFDIAPESGQLLTEKPLDREKRTSYTVTVTATDPSRTRATIHVTITIEDVNEPPTLSGDTVVSVAAYSTGAVATYTAIDPERAQLIWSLGGTDRGAFEISDGVVRFLAPPDFESPANVAGVNTYELTVVVRASTHTASLDVTVIVTDALESALGSAARDTGGPIGSGGRGGGGPSGPTPSDVDFEWTVKRDIEALDPGNDWPTGLWSDGRVLWIAENGDGADDAVYACDLQSGERLKQREFELAEANRAPRGFWSDGETVWVPDSGQERLFAYDLETGERDEEREIVLADRNADARGIWSGSEVMWVLDGRRDALFAYDLETGDLLGEYELAPANSDPRGLWSDGVSVWVSDHGAKRIFAYRLPGAPTEPAAEDADALPLERARDEEFGQSRELTKASNNSPRGLWSDGDVMYVADASDDKVYTYNMPDAIDARLASLTLSGVDIGEFSPSRTEYEGVADDGVTLTTVAAAAEQRGATVAVAPVDADEDAEGHQIALAGVEEIAVTVTSSDGSRERVYRVRIAEAEAAGPSASCLRGAIAVGFSLVASEGGSVEDLAACAQSRHVTALYVLVEGEWVSYILGAPSFVTASFRALFADGIPPLLPLVVRSEGPATPAPVAPVVAEPFAVCLRGAIAEGFNLVVYAGGSVGDLVTCAQNRDVAALYVLDDGVWVSYILDTPEFVNEAFAAVFPEGLPSVTPLIARSD